jgi:2-polyprenyl-3-methyl-5-hydroxy-6-metoxy-1,4-benzoquinol methylase
MEFVSDQGEELFRLQLTLYESKNPTRRWLHRSRRDWIVEAITRWGTESRCALEIGPGSGVYLPTLAATASEVVGVDIEDAYLDRLRPLEREHARLRLLHDDILDSSFEDGSFDLILCSEVIEHIADSRRALAEMRRLLSPSGTLILSTPQKYSPLELFSKLAFLPGIIDVVRWIYKEPILETGHINVMTKGTLRKQLRQAGFTILETYASGVYVPVLAELLGDRALRIEKVLEHRFRSSRWDGFLWTQYVIAGVDVNAPPFLRLP